MMVLRLARLYWFYLLCGLLIVASIVSLFYPTGAVRAETRQQMEERQKHIEEARGIQKTRIEIPGQPPTQGVVTQAVIDAKQEIQEAMRREAIAISDLAVEANSRGRLISLNGLPVPQISGEAQSGLLPKIDAAAGQVTVAAEFRDRVLKLYDEWLSETGPLQAGYVPSAEQIASEKKKRQDAAKASIPSYMGKSLPGSTVAGPALNVQEERAIVRELLTRRANAIKLYLLEKPFQTPSWVQTKEIPNDRAIFDAFVLIWLQSDLIQAIGNVNLPARHVAASPIKRLDKVMIGGTLGSSAGGDLFTRSGANASSGMPGMGGMPMANAQPQGASGRDYSRSLSGRVSCQSYDVTYMTVNLLLEPGAINALTDQLYRQNNGYTLLNVKLEAVDPAEAVNAGYIFGAVPVVKAELTYEAVFYRRWTRKIMPEYYIKLLGILPTQKDPWELNAEAAAKPKR